MHICIEKGGDRKYFKGKDAFSVLHTSAPKTVPSMY